MKKALAVLLAVLLLVTLCACGNKSDSDKKATQSTTAPVGETTSTVATQIIYGPDDEGNLTSQVIILTTAATAPSADSEGETTAPTTVANTTAPSQSEASDPTVTEDTVATEGTTTGTTAAPTTKPVPTATAEQPSATQTNPTTTTTEPVIEDDNVFNDGELQW